MTFRRRLLAASMLTLAVGLGALLVVGNVVLGVSANNDQMRLLQTRVDAEIAALAVRDGHVVVRNSPDDRSLDREAWIFDGQQVVERPAGGDPTVNRVAMRLGRAGRRAETHAADDIAIRAEPVVSGGRRAGTVVVAMSVEGVERLQRYVVLGSLVLAGLLLLAGFLAIRGAVDGALRPVAAMTRDAAAWSANDLDQRFDLGPRRDELTGLAATLDSLLGRIAASRRHEQRFAGEMAHELRTPIARMRGRAELALRAGPDGDEERAAALASVVAEVDRLTRAIDTLLAVARREIDPTAESVDLEAIVREAADGAAVVRASGPLPRGEGDAEVVRRALAPLLENAHRHAAGRVELVLSASGGRVRVAVRDDGPGVPVALGERAFDPGVRGEGENDGGAGLGLALARRLARSCGGDVTLGDGPGGCFVLDLPAIEGGD